MNEPPTDDSHDDEDDRLAHLPAFTRAVIGELREQGRDDAAARMWDAESDPTEESAEQIAEWDGEPADPGNEHSVEHVAEVVADHLDQADDHERNFWADEARATWPDASYPGEVPE